MSKTPRRYPSQQITIVIVDSPIETPRKRSPQVPSSKRWGKVLIILKIISGVVGLAAAGATIFAVIH
jgi:hypothetical protein